MINKTDYYNKAVMRLSMKSSLLSYEETNILKEAYKYNSRDVIYDYAIKTKVLPFVANLFINLNIDINYWIKIYNVYEKRNTQILDGLINIFDIFNSNGINKIFLYENFGALLASETSIGCFSSGDIDLFSDISHKEKINEILISLNFFPKNINNSINTIKTEYFNNKFIKGGFGINVMWKPLSRLKLPFHIDINNSIKWEYLTTYKDTHVKIPTKEALMYLCLLHTSVHSYHRSPDIRLYTDTDRISHKPINWTKILNYAKLDKTVVRVITAAILSNKLLGTAILAEKAIEKYKNKYKNIALLINRVFDNNHNYLKKQPDLLSVLVIEVLSSDNSRINALKKIVFPSKHWIKKYYLTNKGFLIKGYLLHFKNLFS